MFDTAEQLARNNDLVAEAAQGYFAAEALQFDEERGADALARAAALQYRLGYTAQVITTTQALISKYAGLPSALLGQLWLGKAQIATGNVPVPQPRCRHWRKLHPTRTKARAPPSWLATRPLRRFLYPLPQSRTGRERGVRPAQKETERWLYFLDQHHRHYPTRGVRDDIKNDLRFVRGNALWRLGFKAEAVDEFEALRLAFTQDGVAQYQLALHFRDIGLYRQSIAAADTLMRISPAKTPSKLPAFIAKLIYPTYYADLVSKHAEEYALDPLLVFSLIRQESLFEPFAESFAAANGLMQVIPSTGREINGDLNWPPNYDTADLQKPYVSVRFGTYYLAKQRRFFGGDMYASLAAYNGGAGNAQIWKERSGGDPDLFFMSVNFEETQRYLRTVGANYAIYHRLYAK